MKIIDDKKSSLNGFIYVFFFLGTLGIAFSLKGMYSNQPMAWFSRPLAWALIVGFALTVAGLIGVFGMNAMPSFGAFLNEYSDVITAPALLPWLFTGTLLSTLFLPYRMGELKSHTPTFSSESEKKA